MLEQWDTLNLYLQAIEHMPLITMETIIDLFNSVEDAIGSIANYLKTWMEKEGKVVTSLSK